MGTNKLEKRSKKMKKIKNRGSELVDNGGSSGVDDFSKSDVKDDVTDINENNVPAVHVKAHKSKRIRNSKKKDSSPISNYEPAAEDPSNKVKKDKSNKINKNKRKRMLVSDVQNGEVNDAVETEQFTDGSKRKKGGSSGVDDFSKSDVKDDATDINENNVPAVHVKAHKSKRIRNSKKKDSSPISNYEPAAEDPSNKVKKDKSNKINKNKRKCMLVSDVQNEEVNDAVETEQITDGSKRKKDKSKRARKNKTKDALISSEQSTEVNDGEAIQPAVKEISTSKKGKSKKTHKQRKTSHSTVTEPKLVQEVQVVTQDVYQISSGEDDDSKGMKKWIKEYHERRPGIKVLQDQIDDYITAYEEKEEQAKREKQASLAEDGWTVVVHHKGGKKTTDTESGVAVGSVAEAAVREKLAMKKKKDVGLDFYRFQRKEANRSEIMKLQSKFMEDKKRIQQLRAARKFRPY